MTKKTDKTNEKGRETKENNELPKRKDDTNNKKCN